MFDARLQDPDVLHCLLLGAESGKVSMSSLAHRLNMSKSDMLWAMDEARHGRIHKAPYAHGSPERVSEAEAPRAPHTMRHEVFLRDWQRHSIMAMLADGGASFKTLTAILDRNGIFSPVNDRMATLRGQMQRQGFDFEVINSNTAQVRYLITGANAEKARALVANGWVLA